MASQIHSQGDRSVVIGRDAINTLIVTGDHSTVFTGDYERLRDAYIKPWEVFDRLHLERFVGREWLLEEIDAFLHKSDRGYFILEAGAGLGKTTFMAWLIRERTYIHHFCELAPGRTNVGQAVKSLVAQVALAYDLSSFAVEGLLPSAAARSDSLYDLLKQASAQKDPGEKIVLVIDALDEAGTPDGQNVLGLPKTLPEGIFILASQRPVSVALTVDEATTPVQLFPLNADTSENLDDMRRFIEQTTAWPGIAEVVRTSGYSPEEIMTALLDKSEGVWLYLHYVVHEIERGERTLRNLDDLPNGMFKYYAQYWNRWRDENETEWYQTYLPLLASLAVAQEATPLERLIEWAGVNLELQRAQRLLNEKWRAFIAVRENNRRFHYRFYHATLRAFFSGLVEGGGLQEAKANLIGELAGASGAAHSRIVDYYLEKWGGLEDGLPGLQAVKHPDEDHKYGVNHLVTHLEKSDRGDDLHRLLRVECSKIMQVPLRRKGLRGWLAGVLGCPTTQPLVHYQPVWFTARSEAGDVGNFVCDVKRAWDLAEISAENGTTAERAQSISLGVRYALLTVSVNSLTTKIFPALLRALMGAGIWRPHQGLAYALQHPDERKREELLMEVAPQLAASGYPEAGLAAAKRIAHGRRQSETLAKIAPSLPHAMLPALLDRAKLLMSVPIHWLTGLRAETDRDIRAWYRAELRGKVLAGLIPHLPKALLPQARAIALALEQDLDRAYVLADLLPHLPQAEQTTLLANALDAVQAIKDEVHRALVLVKLSPYLPEAEKRKVLQMARHAAAAAQDEVERERLWQNILPLLAELDSPEAALETIQSVKNDANRVEMLVVLAPRLPAALLRKALDLALSLRADTDRAEALVGLAPHLPRPFMRQALAAARELPLKSIGSGLHLPKMKALVGMAPHLPHSEHRDVLRDALGTIESNLKDMLVVYQVLESGYLSQLAGTGLARETLRAAQAIRDPSQRAQARLELLSHLPQPEQVATLHELLAEALTIGDRREREEVQALLSVDAGFPQQALKLGLTLDRNETRAALALRLAQSGYPDEALAAAKRLGERRRFWGGPTQAESLAAIVSYLPEGKLCKAVEIAWGIEEPVEKCKAVAALIPYLPSSERAGMVARVLKVSRKIENVGNQAEVLAALAPCASEPVLHETLTKILALKAIDSQALLLGRVASHLPAQLLQETLAAVRTVDQASDRVRLLDVLAKYLPQDERKRVLREVLAATWEREKGSSRTEGSVTVAQELLKRAYPQAILSTAHSAETFRSREQAEVIQGLAARVSDPLLREVLATAQSWSSERAWAHALADWACWLAEMGHAEEALALARKIKYRETEVRVGALSRLLPYLTQAERSAVLEDALAALKYVETKDLWGNPNRRQHALTELVRGMEHQPYPQCYGLWRHTLRDLASQNRADLLSDLQVLAPVMLKLGDEKTLTETMQAITDVGRWFP